MNSFYLYAGAAALTVPAILLVLHLCHSKRKPDMALYHVGDRVRHSQSGCGTICGVEWQNGNVPVAFDAENVVRVVPRWTLARIEPGITNFQERRLGVAIARNAGNLREKKA